jgi:phosphatidylglycerophosphate synthase
MSFFNYFTDAERKKVGQATNFKNRSLGWAGPLLVRLHIHPDGLSYIGLTLLLGVTIWFVSHPFRAMALIAAYIIIDGLDGSYARFLKRPTQSGAFTDIVADQLGMVVIAIGFIQYDMVDPVIGAYYIMIYLIMITFSVIQNAQGIPMQYIFRTKYILYGIYGLWAITKAFNHPVNLGPILLPAFDLIMTFSVVQSYLRLKRGIYWKYDLPKIIAAEREMREHDQRPPVFWPSLNFILPALSVLIILFGGAYTQMMALLESADVEPEWTRVELTFKDHDERPAAVAAYNHGWLVSTYNPTDGFSRVYRLDDQFRDTGSFRVPFAIHRQHGMCLADDSAPAGPAAAGDTVRPRPPDSTELFIADRLSRRVYQLDLDASMKRGVGVLDASFDTTLTAPVGCALAKLDGQNVMLVSEYLHNYWTVAVDYPTAFKTGTADGHVVGWYRNSGLNHGLVASGNRIFELHGALGEDIIYELDLPRAFATKYIRDAMVRRISVTPWHARGLALGNGRLAVVDEDKDELYWATAPGR